MQTRSSVDHRRVLELRNPQIDEGIIDFNIDRDIILMDISTLLNLNYAHVARGHLATGSGLGGFHRFRHSATILENNNIHEIQNLLRRSNGGLPGTVDILQVADLPNSIANREDAEKYLERQNWRDLLLG